jgi:hypothetical protein
MSTLNSPTASTPRSSCFVPPGCMLFSAAPVNSTLFKGNRFCCGLPFPDQAGDIRAGHAHYGRVSGDGDLLAWFADRQSHVHSGALAHHQVHAGAQLFR